VAQRLDQVVDGTAAEARRHHLAVVPGAHDCGEGVGCASAAAQIESLLVQGDCSSWWEWETGAQHPSHSMKGVTDIWGAAACGPSMRQVRCCSRAQRCRAADPRRQLHRGDSRGRGMLTDHGDASGVLARSEPAQQPDRVRARGLVLLKDQIEGGRVARGQQPQRLPPGPA
jgi:hypothetical protein